ncbi:MAG: glycosyltransferase family 4 protein [Fimbriimonas sp.]
MCSSATTSGAERHVLQLSQLLESRGHGVSAVTSSDGWLTQRLFDAGLDVQVSPMKGRGWLRSVALLAREIRRKKIDVVHTHLTRAAYIGYAAGLLTRTPVVTSVHIANHDYIYRRLAHGRNRLVAVSNFVRGMLHGRGIPDRFIDTVHNGTDFDELESISPETVASELEIPENRKLVGLLGRVCREKGHLEMVAAMPQIRKAHPEAHFVFVGKVEPTFELEMQAAIDSAGISDRLTLTGLRHDVPRLLDAFALTTMPSHRETFGLAALEAMARGKPVVASRVGGLPELVHHQQTGLLVDLRPDEIAEAVTYLLSNDIEREQMGLQGRRMVREKFTLGEMANRFEGVYQRAIG